ncbi:hypothetical protein ACEN2I_16370 [Flavobacterium sp. W22_SRS_FK3]|uniref:hypothetical protein n=1 Tax=Flavobacterium sp. W22_SRS_FK3 TaxID=3240275 RepID=UPI003F8F4862
MITNLPSSKDFEIVSKQCLTQAFNLLFKVYENYEEYEDLIEKDEIPIEKIWEHNSGTIRTSLILLHQGIETFMKSIICETSPLLLIEKKRTEWPSLPSSNDKNFDSLYTISGEALLTSFCAVPSKIKIDDNLINFIEQIRQKRNEAIHGVSKLSITPKELFENILEAYTYFFGKNTWFLEMWNFNFENPLFGHFDWGFESVISYQYLDFAEFMIGRKKLNKYLKIDITGRNYFCPTCKETIDHEYGDLQSKWAFLSPNEPNSKEIQCVNCDAGFVVQRKDCVESDCKGNVIYSNSIDEFCLSCFMPQF